MAELYWSTTYCTSSAPRLLTSSTRKIYMAELYWGDWAHQRVSLRVRGHHAFDEDAYIGGIALRKDYTFACLIAAGLRQHTLPCELVGYATEVKAKQALEAAVWVLLVGGDHG